MANRWSYLGLSRLILRHSGPSSTPPPSDLIPKFEFFGFSGCTIFILIRKIITTYFIEYEQLELNSPKIFKKNHFTDRLVCINCFHNEESKR